MIALFEWIAVVADRFAESMRGVADSMRSARVKALMSKEVLSPRQQKELESLVKNLPDVTIHRR